MSGRDAERHFSFVVIGGGIAGTSCVESLNFWSDGGDVLLITPSPVVKVAKSAIQLTRTLTELDVGEVDAGKFAGGSGCAEILTDLVTGLDHSSKTVRTKSGQRIRFDRLCICTGAQANLIDEANPHVLGIRDTESVLEFQKRISSARRIIVVGNGGIASEIVHEVEGVEKIWVVKDDFITKTFLDPGAAEFFQSALSVRTGEKTTSLIKRLKYEVSEGKAGEVSAPALGPDWHSKFELRGASPAEGVTIEYGATVKAVRSVSDGDWPVRVELTNGKIHYADFVVSATGVTPNSRAFRHDGLALAQDGGILVDEKMETTLPGVFAAGDVCAAAWDQARHWHQMRLWGQARQMGMYAARAMVASLKNEPFQQDFCFEIFTHVTKLFGFKVILLGLFNGQKLAGEYELLVRVTKGREYVKLVLKDGRLHGAMLIGETDLEEMCENLILNQLDLTPFGDDLLNPDIDIEDYFD